MQSSRICPRSRARLERAHMPIFSRSRGLNCWKWWMSRSGSHQMLLLLTGSVNTEHP